MISADAQPVQGMSDIAPPEIRLWQRVEAKTREVMALYGFEEIRTPIVEHTRVFTRAIGDTTDVVQKEMYTFEDRGGRQLSLRPEGTAGVLRYAAGLGAEAVGKRFFYIGPMFRCERPQAGRKRQFHQLGIEAIGAPSPAADVEAIALQHHLLARLGVSQVRLEINTRGEPSDRVEVSRGLADALKPHLSDLCEDCQRRYKVNVLRILDCKQPGCQRVVESLPPVTKFMGEPARKYFENVLHLLNRLEIEAVVNPRLVRGLDYYVHTVWEVRHAALGAQDALSGGGRYCLEFGKQVIEGVGFAVGMERLITAIQSDSPEMAREEDDQSVWLISHGERALEENLVLAQTLRQRGIVCRMDLSGRSMKAQMRAANKSGARRVLIRGDLELEKGIVVMKDMKTGGQEELGLVEAVERLRTGKAEVCEA